MASVEAASEPLGYKTWVLKVSIHCEGCRKKVKRILQKIEGVYNVEVDALQNKATVTGDVDAETLINKLAKSKRHAELWPEKKKPGNPNHSSSSNKSQESLHQITAAREEDSKNSSKSKDPRKSSDSKLSPSGDASAAAGKAADGNEAEETAASGEPAEPLKASSEDTKIAGKQEPQASKEKNAAAERSDSPPDEAANPAGGSEKATGGEAGKKKGKKVKKENDNGGGGGESVGKEASGDNSETGGISPPRPPAPHMYYYPEYSPQPVMSYNMAHPSTSQAYYSTPPVSQGYMYSHYPDPPPPPELYYGSLEPSLSRSSPPPPPAGSYHDMFSDENPNACNLM